MAAIVELATTLKAILVTTTELLPAQPMRNFLHLQNDSANTIFVKFGDVAAVADAASLKMVSGAAKTFENPGVGAIQAIALTGTSEMTITTNKIPLD